MFKKKMAKMLIVAALTLSALVALSGTSYAATANPATAVGYAYWGGFHVNLSGQSIRIPQGQLTHVIDGNNYYVSWDSASFLAAGNLCNTSVRFTYGNGAQHIDGRIYQGCHAAEGWKYILNRKMPGGSACVELYAQNWRVRLTTQCHNIGPSGSGWLKSLF
jgi:hypothetical protein